MNLNQVTLPATDLQQSVRFYRTLGLIQIVSSEHYARFECPEGGSTFSLHKVESAPASHAVVYFECADLDARVVQLQAKGLAFESGPRDERWLWREARLRDPAGNLLCLFWAGENRKNPPWRIAHDVLEA